MEIKKLVKNNIKIVDEEIKDRALVFTEQEQIQMLIWFKENKPVMFMDVVTK